MSRPALTIRMVTEYAYPILGGISEHVHFLSRELVALGHEVTVVTGHLPGRRGAAAIDAAAERDHGYGTHRIGWAAPIPSNGSIARLTVGLGTMRHQVRRAIEGADVVHAQGLIGSRLPLLAVDTSSAPVTVGTYHTYVEGVHWAYRRLNGWLSGILAKLDRRIAVSDACTQSLEPWFPGVYDVIPNGVDCHRFRPLGEGETEPGGPPRILFVGRLEPRNALGDLIKAAAVLAAEGRDFVIQVAGDGPTRGVNERLAEKLGVADRIEWFGLIHDDLPRRYREATVFAAPCTLASFGVILIEALASGTPIVAADNVGFRQVLRDGAPGAFVPMRDPEAMAGALGALLDDPATRTDWALRGRDAAVERYDWPGVARAVEALYREVHERARPAGILQNR